MDIIADVLEALSVLLFCGFMSVFMIPKLFFWIFYAIPQIIRFSFKRKIRFSALMPILERIGTWFVIIVLLYIAAFLIDTKIGYALIFGYTALICWGLAVLVIVWTACFSRVKIQDEFYNDTFLKYITEEQKKSYDQYIENAGKFTYTQALKEQKKKLSYLQKKAVRQRIAFLQDNNDTEAEGIRSQI